MSSAAPLTALPDLKKPPHSLEAEQAVLGAVMIAATTEAWDQVSEILIETDFYRSDHRVLWEALAALAQRGEPLDVVTVSDFLSRADQLDAAGGGTYLATLCRDCPSAVNATAYARIVRGHAQTRHLLRYAQQTADSCYRPDGLTPEELVQHAESRLFQITDRSHQERRDGLEGASTILTRYVEALDALYASDNPITGLPTGWVDLDELTTGLQPGDLWYIAGRPSMGKTSLACGIAEHTAVHQRRPVAFFSLEMSKDQLIMRLLASLGAINMQRLRTGKLVDDDWARLTSAISMLNDAPLYIDDASTLTPGELLSRCRRLARQHGDLALVVVDYLGLMSAPGAQDRQNEVAELSRGLKRCAKDMHCPVIGLSQLNRALEQRADKRPTMADLKDSGAVEADADGIAFIYRDEVYDKESADKGTAEIIVAKQRNGPIGTVKLVFQGAYNRFLNLAR